MITHFRVTLLLLLAASSVAVADERRVSFFDRSKIGRDPFEPLNGKELAEKKVAVVAPVGAEEEDFSKSIRITGVSRDRLGIAVINGRAFAEGESFVLRGKHREIRVTVRKVSASGAELDCGGVLFVAKIWADEA